MNAAAMPLGKAGDFRPLRSDEAIDDAARRQ
jgi:hypothetical protein